MTRPDDASARGGPAEPDSGPKPFAWSGSGHVLVADDEPSVLAVTVRALERLGLSAVGVCDGQQAVDRFREEPARWRLVVLDLTMPRLDGAEAMSAIRSLRPDVPVVISSGYAADELSSRLPGGPGIALLQKPFTVRTLSESVRTCLGAPSTA